jgi:hypothetical protein
MSFGCTPPSVDSTVRRTAGHNTFLKSSFSRNDCGSGWTALVKV